MSDANSPDRTADSSPLPHPHRPGTVRAAFSYRDYRIIWFGLFLSSIGTWMQNLALPAYIDHRTHSAGTVSLLVFAQLGPILLLAVPGGVIADRVNKAVFLQAMQWTQLVFSIVLALIVRVDGPIWGLFLAQTAVGIGNALNAPAFQASVPMLVDRRDLAGAISMNSVQLNLSRVIGPSIAAILALWGVTTAQIFIINAVTYLFLIVALMMVTFPDIRGHNQAAGWRKLLTGIKITRERRVLARLLVGMSTFSLFSLVYVALFASVARINFHISAVSTTYRWLYSVWGLGALLGVLATGSVLAHVRRSKVIRWTFVGFAVTLAGYTLMRHVGPAFPIAFLLGACYFTVANAMGTVFQENLRNSERVTVMPLWFMSFGGTITIGGLVAGPIIDHIGARWVMGFGALYAVFLAWYCNLDRLPKSAFLHD